MSRVCTAVLSRVVRGGTRGCTLLRSLTCSSHSLSDVQQPQKSAADVNLTRLPHRALVNIRGQDGIGFLQGLVTADVLELGHRRSMYSMLLNAQGRVLYDVILYRHGDEHVIMECDSSIVGDIVKHLKRYALRSKVAIESEEDYAVWATYPGSPEEPLLQNVLLSHTDPRVSLLGSRVIALSTSSAVFVSLPPPAHIELQKKLNEEQEIKLQWPKYRDSQVSIGAQVSFPEDYHRHRMKMGVAEGVAEVPVGACFPLEYNVDYMDGVNFSKGCYLGQELTARTHHTGVIRKRVVPVTFQRNDPEVTNRAKIVNASGKNIGKLISRLGDVGLALLRVQEMNGPLSITSESGEESVSLTAHTPSWWPGPDTTA